MIAGFLEGAYQATMTPQSSTQNVVSWISAFSHIIPFALMVMLRRPAGEITRWNGALMLGLYFAILVSLTAIIPYALLDTYPYCLDYFAIGGGYSVGILLALIIGEKTSSIGLFEQT